VIAGDAEIDVPAISVLAGVGKVAVAIRPEQLHVVPGGKLTGIVKAVMPLGAHVVYDVELTPGISLKVSEPRADGIAMRQTGEQVHLAPTSPEACHVFSVQEFQHESQQGVRP
jgi:ABC-type Fe3+/spermidine/putrescine transport system ATPase subunit